MKTRSSSEVLKMALLIAAFVLTILGGWFATSSLLPEAQAGTVNKASVKEVIVEPQDYGVLPMESEDSKVYHAMINVVSTCSNRPFIREEYPVLFRALATFYRNERWEAVDISSKVKWRIKAVYSGGWSSSLGIFLSFHNGVFYVAGMEPGERMNVLIEATTKRKFKGKILKGYIRAIVKAK